MTEALSIKNLNVVYRISQGKRHVLRDVSLNLEKGQIRAIVGESGCGKSTLVNTIISRLPDNGRVESGEILIDGQDMVSLKPEEMRRLRFEKLGVVFQDPFSALDPSITIEKQIVETVNICRKTDRKSACRLGRNMLLACGIREPEEIMKKYPHQLSGGLQQRVMIAMALINEPAILIADEPTTALDVTVQKEILKLLARLARERQLAVLFVTHSLDVAAMIADRISVFYGGRVVEEGRIEDIFNFPLHPYTQALLKTIPSIEYGKNERKLMPIEGEMFSFLDETDGCCFAPRCPYARESCYKVSPVTRENKGHSYACLLEEVL